MIFVSVYVLLVGIYVKFAFKNVFTEFPCVFSEGSMYL